MRLAISNLAWPLAEEGQIASLLRSRGITGMELAPTKIWPRPLGASDAEVRAYRRFWHDQGIEIVALQALLFGRPDLTIFDDAKIRAQTLSYLAGMCRLAEQLGAHVLVFGSPRNRIVGRRAPAEIEAIALDFFARVGSVAQSCGVSFCIEPNPPAYQCDFITNAEQGARLVQAVGNEGFGLHLDTAAMSLGGDSIADTLANYGRSLRHFHVSEPYLRPVGEGTLDHAGIAGALRASGYDGWISIEMKEPENRPVLPSVDQALRFVHQVYLAPTRSKRPATV